MNNNKNIPSLSLIIPCHNLEDYITPLLDSLLIQRNDILSEREILFILDNCTDKTESIIKEKMTNSSYNCKYIVASQGCAGGARNVGLKEA